MQRTHCCSHWTPSCLQSVWTNDLQTEEGRAKRRKGRARGQRELLIQQEREREVARRSERSFEASSLRAPLHLTPSDKRSQVMSVMSRQSKHKMNIIE